MNRTRCPWCGKRIDKVKDRDKVSWQDMSLGHSMLHKANCSHCGHKYGQFPVFPYLFKMDMLVLLLVILVFVFQSALLFAALFLLLFLNVFLHLSMSYSKLDDTGKPVEENTDLYCKMKILEKYGKIKRYELYFLNDSFDGFETFTQAAPIYIYFVSQKSDTVLGEFLYMHEKNYDFMEKESCELYDTSMNLIARIKLKPDSDTV